MIVYSDKPAKLVRIGLNPKDAQVLMYALNRFSEEYIKLDPRAQEWAKLMKRLSENVRDAL